MRWAICNPLVKDREYHVAIGVLAAFGFNAIIHNWFAMLMADKRHFQSDFVEMSYMGFADYVVWSCEKWWMDQDNGGILVTNYIWCLWKDYDWEIFRFRDL